MVEFCKMLEGIPEKDVFKKLRYAVFGCGNTDWETFQAIPRYIDSTLKKYGGKPLVPLTEGDANFDLHGTYDSWIDELWVRLAAEFSLNLNMEEIGKKDFYSIAKVAAKPANLIAENFQAKKMEVLTNRVLCTIGGKNDANDDVEKLVSALKEVSNV